MNILTITYYTVQRYTRARKTNFQMMVFPIIIIFILGSALNSNFSSNQLGVIQVGLLDQGTTPLSVPLEGFLNRSDIKELLEVIPVTSHEEGLKLMEQGVIQSFIKLNQPMGGEEIQPTAIEVIVNPRHSFRNTVLENIFESFVNAANAVQGAVQLKGTPVAFIRHENISQNQVEDTAKSPGSMDYYGVTMLIMILMYGSNYGYYSFAEEERLGLTKRIKAAPVKSYQVFLGKTLAAVVTVFCQAVILVLFTKFIFQVNWGGGLAFVFLVCFTMSLLSTGLGILLGMAVPNEDMGGNLLSALIPLSTFIAGGYVPWPSFGNWMDKIKLLTPNYLGQQALFSYIYGDSFHSSISYFGGLWIMIAVMWLGAILLGRRQVQ